MRIFPSEPQLRNCHSIYLYYKGRCLSVDTTITPPLWTDLVKILTRKARHALSFSLECTDFKNKIFEKIPWAHSEDAEVAEVKLV